jgi:glycosyltransferase involved in cell wall biosynthesis
MRAIFVHDNCFYQEFGTENYFDSAGSFPPYVWDRYLDHFNEVHLISRGKIVNEISSGLLLTSKTRVHFHLIYNLNSAFDYLLKAKEILDAFKKVYQSGDVVILRLPSFIGGICSSYLQNRKIGYYTEVVGCIKGALWNFGGGVSKIIAPYYYFKMKRDVRKSDGSIYVTKFFLQSRYPNKGKINIIASNVEIPLVEENFFEKRNYSLNGPLKVGLIANLEVKYKGFDVLLKAISELPKEIETQIYLVGGGNPEYVRSIAKRLGVSDRLNIVGRLSSVEKVFNFLDDLDIYVHPSKTEGLPRVVIEAMSRACPVLASSVAGTPELLNEDFLHRPGDYKRLKSQILRVYESEELRVLMGRKNFDKARDYLHSSLKAQRSVFWNCVKAIHKENN